MPRDAGSIPAASIRHRLKIQAVPFLIQPRDALRSPTLFGHWKTDGGVLPRIPARSNGDCHDMNIIELFCQFIVDN